MMKSARFLTSPNVHVTLPPNWAAISVGPCQSEVWLSTTPPIISASATAPRVVSHVTLLSPYTKRHVGVVENVGRDFDGLGHRGLLAVDQRIRIVVLRV